MSLSINDEVSAMRGHNPYALTETEALQMQAFDNMTADEQGALFHASMQQAADQAYLDSRAMDDLVSSNDVQHLAGGGVVVGGALQPNSLVTIGGLEMTVQQAIDAGVYSSDALGQQVSEMGAAPESDQAGMLAGIPSEDVYVNDWGQVLTEDADGDLWLFDESQNSWVQAHFDE